MTNIIDKARKLLHLKERAGTPGEAQAAARALAHMLDKHRITITELEMRGDADSEHIVVDRSEPLLTYGCLTRWKRKLITALCQHYGVARWRRSRVGRRRHALHLCGRPSDIAMVRFMFAWLSAEIDRLARIECAGRGLLRANSWRAGFVLGIDGQLNGARDSVVKHHGDAALVLRLRNDDAHDFLRRAVDVIDKKTYHNYMRDSEARAAGKRRGEKQHLGDKLDGGVHRALPEAV